ncbi:F-box protein [Glycine soja]
MSSSACGVKHEDLKQLFHVSKTIREGICINYTRLIALLTMMTKEMHFNTPMKKNFVFLNSFDLEDANGFKKIEASNRLLRKAKSRLNGKKLDEEQ